MAKTATIEKRKTYSLAPSRARELSRSALSMSEELGATIPRQNILDALVGLLADKGVYAKVKASVK